jgi:SAM-dependent methyltransferase
MDETYNKTKSVYEKLGQKYLTSIQDLTPPEFYEFIKLLPKNASVLEVGCAGGRDAEKFIENGFEVTGIDVVDEFLESAKNYCSQGTFINMDVTSLDFPNESFDGIWAHAVLLHLNDRDLVSALQELKNVLKPGGYIFVSLKLGEKAAVVTDTLSQGEERYFNFTSAPKILNLLNESGLDVIKKKITPDDAGRPEIKWIRIFARKGTK